MTRWDSAMRALRSCTARNSRLTWCITVLLGAWPELAGDDDDIALTREYYDGLHERIHAAGASPEMTAGLLAVALVSWEQSQDATSILAPTLTQGATT